LDTQYFNDVLSTGAFGTVYKGIVTVNQTDGTPELINVAVKTINAGAYKITRNIFLCSTQPEHNYGI